MSSTYLINHEFLVPYPRFIAFLPLFSCSHPQSSLYFSFLFSHITTRTNSSTLYICKNENYLYRHLNPSLLFSWLIVPYHKRFGLQYLPCFIVFEKCQWWIVLNLYENTICVSNKKKIICGLLLPKEPHQSTRLCNRLTNGNATE